MLTNFVKLQIISSTRYYAAQDFLLSKFLWRGFLWLWFLWIFPSGFGFFLLLIFNVGSGTFLSIFFRVGSWTFLSIFLCWFLGICSLGKPSSYQIQVFIMNTTLWLFVVSLMRLNSVPIVMSFFPSFNWSKWSGRRNTDKYLCLGSPLKNSSALHQGLGMNWSRQQRMCCCVFPTESVTQTK